jgi:putative component of toxin-antitoxin plasmid stabilization module
MSYTVLIYDYVNIDNGDVIKPWLDQLRPIVKAKVNARLNTLEQINRTEWAMPLTEVLKGDKDGLIAIRIKYQGIEYRLLGYDGPFRGEFTLLANCTERNNKYIPLDVGSIANERRRSIEANPIARRTRHDFR